MLKITHSFEEGTLVHGTSRGDPALPILKQHGFRWFHSIGLWGLRGSRDHFARTVVIEDTASHLRRLGIEVEVDVDDTPRAAADIEADRTERLEARQDALDDKAVRLAGEADALYRKTKGMMDTIPFGQPMMPGHYSYNRDRNFRDRIDQNVHKTVVAWNAADAASGRGDASRQHQARMQSGPVTVRRIDRLETELRQIDRILAKPGSQPRDDEPRIAEWRTRLGARREYVTDQIAYWREHLAKLEAEGIYTAPDPARYPKGQRILTVWGEATVVRANAKTLTVTMPPPQIAGLHHIRYDDVKGKVPDHA
jgi:Domain of unknown function (DUF3560)